jgi:hypothetical protein
MAEAHSVIAAFVDGERVAPDALAQALADQAGRDYLIDLLVLRRLVQTAGPEMEIETPRLAPLARGRSRWLGIAAALVASVLGGYVAGRRTAPVVDVPAVAAVVEKSPQPARPETAPQPTRVIRLEPGVDWKENIGG